MSEEKTTQPEKSKPRDSAAEPKRPQSDPDVSDLAEKILRAKQIVLMHDGVSKQDFGDPALKNLHYGGSTTSEWIAGIDLAELGIATSTTNVDQSWVDHSQTFTLDVTDQNEAASAIDLAGTSLAENAAGAAVGTLTTHDPDAGDSHSYQVSDARFEVVDGTLKLKDGVSLDHEAEPSVAVTVTATDQGGLSHTQTFTLDVTDDGNQAASLDLNVSELVAPGNEDIPTMSFGTATIINTGQTETVDGAGNGESALWSNVGTFQGMDFDVRATIVSTTSNHAEFSTTGDNAAFWTQSGETEVRYEFLEAGTDNILIINGSFLIDDLDGGTAQEAFAINMDQVDVYGVENGGDIDTSSPSADHLQFSGQGYTNSGDSTNAVAFNMSGTGGFTITYSADAGTRAFYLDGNWTDGYFDDAVAVDTNDNHADVFTEGADAVSIASKDIKITDVDDTVLEGAIVKLTNAQADDELVVGDLPPGISAEVDTSVPGEILVTLSGSATPENYETALQEIRFQNTSSDPATIPREIEVVVDDGDQLSDPAVSTIYVNDIGAEGLEANTGSNVASDTLTGNSADNTLFGLGGDDVLFGGSGDDVLVGGTGDDTMFGGDGNDLFTFQSGQGHNVVYGGGGWTDAISIEGMTSANLGTDWTVTLETGSVVDQNDEAILLSEDASGFIDLDDGTRIEFHEISQIHT